MKSLKKKEKCLQRILGNSSYCCCFTLAEFVKMDIRVCLLRLYHSSYFTLLHFHFQMIGSSMGKKSSWDVA